MTLEELSAFVAERWPFDENNYDQLRRIMSVPVAVRTKFSIMHIHKHLSKTVGLIADFLEPLDHQTFALLARYLDSVKCRNILAMVAKNLLVSTVRLIEAANLAPYDANLERQINEMTLSELCSHVEAHYPFGYGELGRIPPLTHNKDYDTLRLKFALEDIHYELSEATGVIGKFLRDRNKNPIIGNMIAYMESPVSRKELEPIAMMLTLNMARLIGVMSLAPYLEEEFSLRAYEHHRIHPKNKKL
ncbi:MAG: hypothetical protein HYT98_03090 [Candidatus Sungbacteria bacterium]|nr:hypothetical protein [Candidatus Sungbacteria bacterium]